MFKEKKFTERLEKVISVLETLLAEFEKKVRPRVRWNEVRWALAVAINCVKKQIPIEPVVTKVDCPLSPLLKNLLVYKCGDCGAKLGSTDEYCHACGTRVKWGARGHRADFAYIDDIDRCPDHAKETVEELSDE